MAHEALENPLDEALDRIEQALFRLETAAAAAPPAMAGHPSDSSAADGSPAELATLRARHRKLKDTVTQEIQQLDLLLANLPQ